MRLRVRIREQLCLLVALTSLLSLTVLAVSTWIESYDYITQVRSQTLSVTANLRASQIAADLGLNRDLVQALSTRSTIQSLLRSFNTGNNTEAELRTVLSRGIDGTLLLQAAVFPHADQLDADHGPIANATGEAVTGTVPLPYNYDNGSQVYLGDPGLGYPRELYPNFTWIQDGGVVHAVYDDRILNYDTTLVLGPLASEDKSALLSFTVAINNNSSTTDTMGWLTVVVDARLFSIVYDPVGLGQTGEILIVGAPGTINLFHPNQEISVASGTADLPVVFVLPPNSNDTVQNRHDVRATDPTLPFLMDAYPAVTEAFSSPRAGSRLSTHNEEGKSVSVGYARVSSNLVDWVVIFEESREEVMSPINRLQRTMIACIFSVFGAIVIVCWPIAHYAVRPIQALRNATGNSIMTYEAELPDTSSGSQSDPESLIHAEYVTATGIMAETGRRRKKPKMQRRRQFQIPEKVPDRKHLIHDELSDLTGTFNDMSDELKLQYGRLEDRVKKRTAELEKSRDLARAADESKTLFIANVSHELRTPLNGIIGMCSVAMQEEEVSRIRQSINIIYKSSDLLLQLLNDLLTFSRNSYGQQLAIEQGVFRLGDIGTQLVSIFEKQVREKDISLKVVFQGVLGDTSPHFDDTPEDVIYAKPDMERMLKRDKTNVLARGPADTGPLRDMALVGDKNRILQVLMNLVSNSLKFTPADGMIEVRIRCKGFVAATETEHIEIESATTAVASSKISEKRPITPITPVRQLKFDFECEDTGPGVPEHLQQEIFKPFVQGDLALSRKHGGTGLGLAICAQLVTLMGGAIHMKSRLDVGSTFTCSIPLGYSTEEVPSVAGSLAPASRRGSQRRASLTSPIDDLSTESTRPPTRGSKTAAQPAQESLYSAHQESPQQLDNPCIVAFSHSSLNEKEAKENDSTACLRPKSERQISARAINKRSGPIESHESNLEETANGSSLYPDPTLSSCGERPKQNSGTSERTPILRQAQTPAHAATRQPPTPRILVAEDNKINQEVIMRMLKLEKVTDAVLAEDGVQAVAKVRDSIANEAEFSLIFMDIQMPNMDGIEATKEIRKLGFEAPIVALTAFDHETNREACSSAGVNDFVGKPLKRKALKEVLEKFGAKDTGVPGKEKEKEKSQLRQLNTL